MAALKSLRVNFLEKGIFLFLISHLHRIMLNSWLLSLPYNTVFHVIFIKLTSRKIRTVLHQFLLIRCKIIMQRTAVNFLKTLKLVESSYCCFNMRIIKNLHTKIGILEQLLPSLWLSGYILRWFHDKTFIWNLWGRSLIAGREVFPKSRRLSPPPFYS